MSETANRIEADLKTAMKAQERERTGTLRMVKAALTNRRIEKREELNEEEVVGVLVSMLKQRKDSIDQFTAGNRPDLADKERVEVEIISAYLPAQMDEAAVRAAVAEAVAVSGAAGPREMGKVMAVLMPKVKGRADGKLVNSIVKEMLGG